MEIKQEELGLLKHIQIIFKGIFILILSEFLLKNVLLSPKNTLYLLLYCLEFNTYTDVRSNHLKFRSLL